MINRNTYFISKILTVVTLVYLLVGSSPTYASSVGPRFNPNIFNDTRPSCTSVLSIPLLNDGRILAQANFLQGNRFERVNVDGSIGTRLSVGGNVIANLFFGVALPRSDGTMIIGDSFTTFGDIERGRVAMLYSDGSVGQKFNSMFDGAVTSLVKHGNNEGLAGGLFKSVDGVSQAALTKLNVSDSLEVNSGGGMKLPALLYLFSEDTPITPNRVFIGGASCSDSSDVVTATLNIVNNEDNLLEVLNYVDSGSPIELEHVSPNLPLMIPANSTGPTFALTRPGNCDATNPINYRFRFEGETFFVGDIF